MKMRMWEGWVGRVDGLWGRAKGGWKGDGMGVRWEGGKAGKAGARVEKSDGGICAAKLRTERASRWWQGKCQTKM